MRLRIDPIALLVLLAGSPCVAQTRAPSLHERAPAATGSEDGAARALPLQVVLCVDREARRCFTAASVEECRSNAGADVFRVLSRGDGSTSHGGALADCWKSLAPRR